jgi:uncharacterized iron-regulated membrane protein
MMHTLRLIHRWIGLLVALPIVLVSISGGLLVFRDPYYRARWPVVAQQATAAEHAAQPLILQQLETTFGTTLRTVKFPREGVNAFHVYLTEEREGLVDPRSGEVLATWHWKEDPAAFLFQLHAHLLMGAQGELLNGYLAVILLFIALSGLVLWFPRRRTAFRLRHAAPAGLSGAALLKSHAASGVLLLLPVALFAATGAGLVFYEQVGAVAERVLNSTPAELPTAVVAPRTETRADWIRLLTAARTALPESGPTMCYLGRGANVVFTCRKRLPGEWHPNGRSYVLIDPYTADVLQTIDARRQGAGTRMMHAFYPIHAAKTGGVALALLAVATALGLGWLAIGGSWTFLARALRRPSLRRAGAQDGRDFGTAPTGSADLGTTSNL